MTDGLVFQLDTWKEAMEKNGLDIAFYANRERNYEEIFPWDHIDVGVTKKFLIRENEKAREDKVSPRLQTSMSWMWNKCK